jgi:hypothetical protein
MATWQYRPENGRVLSTSGKDADFTGNEFSYDVNQKQWWRFAKDVRIVTLVWKTKPAVSLIHVPPCLHMLTDGLHEK